MPATQHIAASKLLFLAVFFAVLVLLAAYFAAMNWWGFLANIGNRRSGIQKHYSPAPFLSAVVAIPVCIADAAECETGRVSRRCQAVRN